VRKEMNGKQYVDSKINYMISRKLYTAKDIKSEEKNSYGFPKEPVFENPKVRYTCIENGWKFAGYSNGSSKWQKVTIKA